jgi:chromate transport protein ChrA
MLGIALGIRNVESQLPDLVYALLSGLNSATVGLIALAAVQLSERQITNQMTRLLVCVTACVGLLYRGMPKFHKRSQLTIYSVVVLPIANGSLRNCNGDIRFQSCSQLPQDRPK